MTGSSFSSLLPLAAEWHSSSPTSGPSPCWTPTSRQFYYLCLPSLRGWNHANLTTNSFPYQKNETVPVWLLLVLVIAIPVLVILVVCLVLVPGNTVPVGTPKALIWKRKFWELHAGWLGLALSIVATWFITNGMKNLFGRPRPDLISRCEPDLANFSRYIVGGVASEDRPTDLNQVLSLGMLVSAEICQQTDDYKLHEGFRSYPSGHSSASSAGLIYLSLFLASKFAVTFPYVTPSGNVAESAFSAFPSQMTDAAGRPSFAGEAEHFVQRQRNLRSIRRQAAAPPIYLLVLMVAPTLLSVFIAGSRWWDFRHHVFDIMFGYFIGLVASVFAFYYYHLPMRSGAGWAWGPRSHDKAWWSGVGSHSYATDKDSYLMRAGDEEEALRRHSVDVGTTSTQVEEHMKERRRNGANNGSSHQADDAQGADSRVPDGQGDERFQPYSSYSAEAYQQNQSYDATYNAR